MRGQGGGLYLWELQSNTKSNGRSSSLSSSSSSSSPSVTSSSTPPSSYHQSQRPSARGIVSLEMAQESEAMTEQKSQSQVHYFLNATCMIAKISQKELDSGTNIWKVFLLGNLSQPHWLFSYGVKMHDLLSDIGDWLVLVMQLPKYVNTNTQIHTFKYTNTKIQNHRDLL